MIEHGTNVTGVTGDTLRAIADTLDVLVKNNLNVTEFQVACVTVGVRRSSDQRAGDVYLVTRIGDVRVGGTSR